MRYHNPQIGRWHVVDPMAEKYYGWSPYNYVADNPLKFVDPDGMMLDGYTVDKEGNMQWADKTGGNEFDVLFSEDEYNNGNKNYDTGNEKDGISVDKGFVENKRTNQIEIPVESGQTDEIEYKPVTLDEFDVTGDEKAIKIFEFLSTNTEVEWGITQVGSNEGDKGANVLTTIHEESTNAGLGYLFLNGYTIRGSSHSHPYSKFASKADRETAGTVGLKFPEAKFHTFYRGSYYQYNEKRTSTTPKDKP